MDNIVIGWPEGILITLMFINLGCNAVNNGKPKGAWSFPAALVDFMIFTTLLFLGGFFQ